MGELSYMYIMYMSGDYSQGGGQLSRGVKLGAPPCPPPLMHVYRVFINAMARLEGGRSGLLLNILSPTTLKIWYQLNQLHQPIVFSLMNITNTVKVSKT